MSFHKEKLQLCHWEEVFLVVNVNGEVISVIETTAVSNPILQTPFGVWKNTILTSIILINL
jgi:hypothetical protein